MASTDSYRLALYEKGIDGGPGEDKKAVIPARALSELARLSEMSDTIEVALTENQAVFKIASVVLATRLIDGNFPEYGRLLPDSFTHDFEIPAQQLRESLKRANLFSGASAKSSKGGSPGAPVRFTFSAQEGSLTGGRLTISSKSADTGQAVETLDATVPEGTGEFVTAFNGRYIADGVAQMIAAGAESVRIRANEPLKPIILSPADKSGEPAPGEFTYLIMPMRDTESEAETKKEQTEQKEQKGEKEPAAKEPENSSNPAEENAAEEKNAGEEATDEEATDEEATEQSTEGSTEKEPVTA
jgi:DNA polymerase-3 subunit beta